MAACSSVLAWRIPGTGEPRGLPSVDIFLSTEVASGDREPTAISPVLPQNRTLIRLSYQQAASAYRNGALPQLQMGNVDWSMSIM